MGRHGPLFQEKPHLNVEREDAKKSFSLSKYRDLFNNFVFYGERNNIYLIRTIIFYIFAPII
jgi:hypothetical protein